MPTNLPWAELPPRARRIHRAHYTRPHQGGTTSACAENTSNTCKTAGHNGNYLRVRGEYHEKHPKPPGPRELPPRARRIPLRAMQGCSLGGTTSACAENTYWCAVHDPHHGNYLRVRGEYPMRSGRIGRGMELPPRARRIRKARTGFQADVGTTSACAENTRRSMSVNALTRNYLRVRGEYHSYYP